MISKEIEIIYIGGYGRSGSTLLDIIIGNISNGMSCGEVCFLPENGIRDNEFCSCGSRVLECNFWKNVIIRWNESRVFSNEEYITYYKNYFRNKRFFLLMHKLIFPDKKFMDFLEDTRKLYEAIWLQGKYRTIIDSSKSPYRLLLLKRIGFNIKTVHIIRSIKGVLYSTSKLLKANPVSGIERDISPRNKIDVIITWMLANILMVLFSRGTNRVKVTYEELLSGSVQWAKKIPFIRLNTPGDLALNGPFIPGHLVAGGRVRMNKSVFIDKKLVQKEKLQASGITNRLYIILDKIFI